jgi:hypothetical protein
MAGALLAVGTGVVLVARAADGVHTTESLTTNASVRQAAAQDSFYDCVSNQVRELVPAGASVWIATDPNNSEGLSLLAAVLRWADVAPDPQTATLLLRLAPGSGKSACSGLVVYATREGG